MTIRGEPQPRSWSRLPWKKRLALLPPDSLPARALVTALELNLLAELPEPEAARWLQARVEAFRKARRAPSRKRPP